jgi:hypothetical protein
MSRFHQAIMVTKTAARITATPEGLNPVDHVGIRHYPIRQTTTPVPVEGGVEDGALPNSAGTSPHGRRKPNGSAFHRRIMAAVQEEAKHAISATSPLKSCDVEKPQPQR